MRRLALILGLILILAGVVLFLSHMTPPYDAAISHEVYMYWPLLFVVIGILQLRNLRHGKVPLAGMFFILLGIVLTLRHGALAPWLFPISAWIIFWSLLLVYVGARLFVPKARRRKLKRMSNSAEPKDDSQTPPLKPRGIRKYRQLLHRASRFVDRHSIGEVPWTIRDMKLHYTFGNVWINFATAEFQDRPHRVDLKLVVGDCRVYIPQNVAVSVDVNVRFGNANIFSRANTDAGAHLRYQDADFQEAPHQLVLKVDVTIGEVIFIRV